MTTFAVAEPSYVTTSRRDDVVGAWPVIVTVAVIERVIEPAVGYGRVLVLVGTGMTTALIVSPATRLAVKAPFSDVPVVVSVPADVPFTVRCALPFAKPVTV